MENIKYPIGPLSLQVDYTAEELDGLIQDLVHYPQLYKERLDSLDQDSLKKTYREGSWNIAQIAHHVADMQLLHYFRMKKALTEPDYKEVTLVNIDGWAQLPDARKFYILDSLELLESVHARFVSMVRFLSPEQYHITYYHATRKIYINQKQAIAMAAWHVKHHYAHIGIALGLTHP